MPEILLDDERAEDYVRARHLYYGTGLYYQYLFDLILKDIPRIESNGAVFLDLFSGHGDLGNHFREKFGGAFVVAADISFAMLSRSPLPCRVLCDARYLPFRNSTISGVMICGGLHHVRTDECKPTLREIHRTLRDSAWLNFFEPVDDNLLVKLLRAVFYKLMDSLGDRENEEAILHLANLKQNLQLANFSVEYSMYVGNLAYAFISQTDVTFWSRFLARNKPISLILLKLEGLIQRLPCNGLFSFGCVVSSVKHQFSENLYTDSNQI